VQYQAVMQMAAQSPQIYDMVELNKQMLEVLGVKNIAKLIPAAEDQKPKDPVTENMAIINGKPVKAFLYQDHQAHIQVHMSAMQDPKIMQIVGQNPQAQMIQAAAMAHINEHIAFEYRKQIEEQLGAPLPDPEDTIPQDVEVDIAKLTAVAAQKLLQKNQAEAQQQQAQQQAQDPLIQMQQAELQIKQQEAQAKAQKMMADTQLDQQRLELDKMKMESQERIAGVQIGAKTELEKAKLEIQQSIEGVKIGVQATQSSKAQEQKLEQMTIDAIDRLANHEQSIQDRTHAKQQAANQFISQMAQMKQKEQLNQQKEIPPPTEE
jgi:hypothetical protein